MPIHLLPDDVASQIAAGEVVERPASVIKELVENALDAGAAHITVRVEKAGKALMEVSDDGAGIPAEELLLAVTRHATSKLSQAGDLFRIATLGFRGEALASIASVSRLTIISCLQAPAPAAKQPAAARLRVEGGSPGMVEPTGAPGGTLVRVEDLFFNVPARMKFLKQDYTERQQIDAWVTRYAIAYPQVRFSLYQDGKPTLQTSGKGDRREVLAALYGVEIARQMIEVSLDENDLSLRGFTSPVSLTRSNRREVTFFVNGRWVQDTALTSALLQAYHTLLMIGRYPLAVIFLHLNPEEVDVNVHPAKEEVRFRQQERVFSVVQRGIRRALLASSPVPQVSVAPPLWRAEPRSRQIDPAWEMAGQAELQANPVSPASNDFPEPQAETGTVDLPSGQIPLLRLVGQVGATYLVAEGPDGLYLIDQHAAHERVLFERMQRQHASGSIPSQALLEAALVQLPPAQAHLLEEQLDLLQHLGFQMESFGPGAFRLRAIPALFTGSDPAAALRALVEDFEEDETPLQAVLEDRLTARICKRMAIKGGQIMSPEEQRALLESLETCQSPRTCPHGRPTMIHLSVDLLERQFGRRGAR
jgi:DNA mismatch repair protein MutL